MKGIILKNTSISQKAMKKKKDWCTSAPETWRGKDLSESCKEHDLCYGPRSEISRWNCDKFFRKSISDKTSFLLGWTMWTFVRLFGGSHYEGKNK